jgi:hypothetical protein
MGSRKPFARDKNTALAPRAGKTGRRLCPVKWCVKVSRVLGLSSPSYLLINVVLGLCHHGRSCGILSMQELGCLLQCHPCCVFRRLREDDLECRRREPVMSGKWSPRLFHEIEAIWSLERQAQ